MDSRLEKLTGKMRKTNQRLAGLQLQAQQPRLAAKAYFKQDKTTSEKKKYFALDERFENTSSIQVDGDPINQTRFGDEFTKSLALIISNDMLRSTKAPKRPSRGFHPWRCARQHPPVAYRKPVYPLYR